MKNASVARKGVVAKKCAIRALAERSLDTWVGNENGGRVYPLIVKEKVRNGTKKKGDRSVSVGAQQGSNSLCGERGGIYPHGDRKSPEAIEDKGVAGTHCAARVRKRQKRKKLNVGEAQFVIREL
jgi:hypothetical protein